MSEKNVSIKLPRPHAGQQQVLGSKAKFKVLCCGRRWGKSTIAIIASLKTMLEGKKVIYITPVFSLGLEFFNKILEILPKEIISSTNRADLNLKLITGGEIKFFSGESTRSIRGFEADRAIIDEASYINDLEAVWTQVLMPALSNTNGDAFFLSTPSGRNYFYSIFQKGLEKEEDYESFHFPSESSPFVSKKFLKTARKNVSEEVFRQEYLAIPMANDGNPFGNHIRKNIIESLSTEPTVIYGVDVASLHDYTVIIGLSITGKMTYFDRFRGEWMLTEEKIKALPKNIMKVIDSTGVGQVIFQKLQQESENIQGFVFTTRSKPSIMRELIVDVQKGNIKYNLAAAEEMESFKYTISSTGTAKYSAASGFHDDIICALAIANHFSKQAWNNQNWKLYYT